MSELRVVPITFEDAKDFVREHHRHHLEPHIRVLQLGVALDSMLVGVAIAGLPNSRVIAAEGYTLEVIRTAVDGTRNANSMLYAACWRAAKALGWDRLITYNQEGESGESLRGAGFRIVAERPARGSWDMPSRPRKPRLCQPCGEPIITSGIKRTLWEAS